jgi:hypothetical protein
MPENVSSLMGGNFAGAPKKKLKKQGDYWVDEQGNQYLDAEGTQPVAGVAKNVQSPTSFFDQIKNDPQAQGSVLTGEVSKRDLSTGGERTEDQGPPDEEADNLYLKNEDYLKNTMGISKAEWRKKWASWNEEGRKKTRKMLAQGQS